MFSARSMEAISGSVGAMVQSAAEQMIRKSLAGKAINIQQVYRCITVRHLFLPFLWSLTAYQVDVISNTLFGQSQNLVESEEKTPEFLVSIDLFTSRMWLSMYSTCLILPGIC